MGVGEEEKKKKMKPGSYKPQTYVRIYVALEPRLGDLREVPRKLTVSFLLSTLASFLNLSATTYFPKSSDRSSVHLVLGFCLPSVAETR